MSAKSIYQMPAINVHLSLRQCQLTLTRITIWMAILVLWNSAPALGQPAPTETLPRYTIEQFLKTINYRGASFSPDKTKLLVSSDASGVYNIYAIGVDGQSIDQVTESTVESIQSIGYFPSDERMLYTADQGGNELNHIYVRETDGTIHDLTPGGKLKANFLGWAHDQQSFYVATNERDPRYFDLYEYSVTDDASKYPRELVFENNEGFSIGDISRDGQNIALVKTHTRDDSDIYLYDRESKNTKHITPHEGDVNHRVATFTPDGKQLIVQTDADHEFNYLVRWDLATGNIEPFFKRDWNISSASYSHLGNFLTLYINEDAKTKIEVYDAASFKPITLPSVPGANIDMARLSKDEKHWAMYVSSGTTPGDLYYCPFGDVDPKQLVQSLNDEIDPHHLVAGEVVRFSSFDDVEIPGILYMPHEATDSNKVPALVWVHGGPGGQSRLGYRALIQYLVNHGIAVYAINNRGSSGYGKSFQQLDDQRHGEGDLMDCVASKQMLSDTGLIDGQRIGIIGGSYGGYMVLAALAFQPEEFALGVDIFGVANWHRTVQNIPPWWEAQRAALEKEMGDFDDEEYFKKISPLFHAANIRRPLMVLQGANDPRVLKVESDEMVAAVKKNNVPVEYIVFDDEGHGFRKKENQLEGYRAILDFVRNYLNPSS